MEKKLAYLTGLVLGAYMALTPNVNAQTKLGYGDLIAKVVVRSEVRNNLLGSYTITGVIINPDLRSEGLKIFHNDDPSYYGPGERKYLDLYINPKDTIEVKLSKYDLKKKRISLYFEDLKRVNGEKIYVPEVYKSKY